MKKRYTMMSAIAILVSLLVASCGSTSSSSAKVTQPSKQVTVTLWSWTPVATTMDQAVRVIEKKYPNIILQTNIEPHPDYNTALAAAAKSNSLPDIVGLPAGSQTQAYRQYLIPLNKIAEQLWGPNWEQDFPKPALEQAQLGNPPGDHNFYMLPEETEVLTVWYYKPIFEKLHLSVPTTLDQLISDAHKISAAGYIPFFEGAAQYNFVTWMFLQFAAQYDLNGMEAAARGQGSWDTPAMIKAAETWKEMFTDGVFEPGALGQVQYPTGANLFAAGKVGMILLGSWWLQESAFPTSPEGLKTMSDYGFFAMPPAAPGLSATPPLGGVDFGWGITKNAAKNPNVLKAAELVLKEMISGAGEQLVMNQVNDLPAFKGIKPTVVEPPLVTKYLNIFEQQVKVAHNHLIGSPAVEQALDSNLEAVAAGTETPSQAMAKVEQVAMQQAS
jgi:raffinose/stachyose/melibiose transport system substrate-binding protein